MSRAFRILEITALLALSAGCVLAQDRTAEFRSRFVHESDPIHKAMLLVPLGNAEFLEIQKGFEEGDLPEALAVLQMYRDEARTCKDGLEAKGIDAERHPSGFKQLQISLREALRRLDDLVITIPRDEQAPFLDVRKDIDEMNRRLIGELFPRQPNAAEPAKKKE